MSKREIERTVQPSVLDRLTDDDPRTKTDRRITYADSLLYPRYASAPRLWGSSRF